MNDITKLAQSMKVAAKKATPGQWVAFNHTGSRTFSVHTPDDNRCGDVIKWAGFDGQRKAKANAEFIALANPANVLSLVEALEKAQGMEAYWKTQCRGITDHCEELQARIAELESHTVKPPVHPTVASEKLDDETLQELIEFRRTTFEYHSKEGNKVQTIIHGVTLAALRELQERRKADSEPVATLDVQSRRPDGNKFALVFSSAAHKLPDDVYFLYRHAQPAPERDQVRIAHAEWSQATFGNVGPVGPLKHLSKEALEAAEQPGDLSEWADMQFLLWDAQRRAGVTDEQITQAMIDKLAVNKQRKWPEPKDGEPRLHIKEQPAPVVPDSYVMVPMRLTAENGAKGALSGEFSETKFVNCPECFGDDECETCDGSGTIEITVPVTWTTIKEIWAKGVEHFTAAPQEVKGE
ncbi:DUF550 domain-containing protein [Klebsiella michiganensis]|nr:DUF550 domain-containing protein [Klebsiella michiganensis]HBR4856838.1 DUF550 domain-containing protein [Klebsiella pneumoniae]